MLEQPINIHSLIRTGGRLGSNPAGIYQNQAGESFYIKQLESPMHAKNEWLAAQLYRLCGAPTFEYLPSIDTSQIITRWIPLDKKSIAKFSEQETQQAQQWLAVHAWTANWDAAGYLGDNQGTYRGDVLTLDVGGALNYRAHGDPKGKAFSISVPEIETLRASDDNPYAKRLFGTMSNQAVIDSIEKVAQLDENAVQSTLLEHGASNKLIDKMLARRQSLIDWASPFSF